MGYVGYAVELYFDPDLTPKIRTLWDAIRTTCGGVAVGVHPHISLAVVNIAQPEQLRTLTQAFAQQASPLPIQLDAIGTFPGGEGVVYLAPVVTLELLELHRNFHQQLTANGLASFPYYRPGRWIPHCTVGIRLPQEKIACAIDLCRSSAAFQSGSLPEISLIELPAVREIVRFPLGDHPL
jgi:2'-5' RNA ligase